MPNGCPNLDGENRGWLFWAHILLNCRETNSWEKYVLKLGLFKVIKGGCVEKSRGNLDALRCFAQYLQHPVFDQPSPNYWSWNPLRSAWWRRRPHREEATGRSRSIETSGGPSWQQWQWPGVRRWCAWSGESASALFGKYIIYPTTENGDFYSGKWWLL